METANFVHLRVHSDFSMMDGLNKVKPILAKGQRAEHARRSHYRPDEHVRIGEVLR